MSTEVAAIGYLTDYYHPSEEDLGRYLTKNVCSQLVSEHMVFCTLCREEVDEILKMVKENRLVPDEHNSERVNDIILELMQIGVKKILAYKVTFKKPRNRQQKKPRPK
jgi:hypothetical protein